MIYKKVNEITMKEIIEEKINFTLNNDIFDEEEFKNYNEGEIIGYNQMMKDIEKLQVISFVEKYEEILKDVNEKLDKKLDEKINTNIEETEKLVGYNNAIVSILEIINPISKYNLD